MQLSIIIVNFNVKYFLEQCLFSVIKASASLQTEVWVVDNNSTDDSIAYLQPLFPSVHFIALQENIGFARANNLALQKVTGKYVLYLNPDTIVPENGFTKCIDFLETNPLAGALGVRMLDGSGTFLKESKRAFPSPFTSMYKLFGLASLFPTSPVFAKYHLGHLDEYSTFEVDVLAGAFIMARRDVLNDLSGFDEAFFMYGEDIDLSYRIQQKGYKNYYFSETSIIHFKGESARKGSLNYVRMFYNAMRLFVNKHYSGGKAFLYSGFIHVAIWVRALLSLVSSIFKMAFKNAAKKPFYCNALIVSNEEQYESVSTLIAQSDTKPSIAGRICISDDFSNTLGGNVNDITKFIHEQQVTEIIFCENGLLFEEIIEIIQRLPKNIKCYFHAKGSNSIVGSSSKNSTGEFLSRR